MTDLWKMANGQTIETCKMTDDHLRNAIEMLRRVGEDGSHVCTGTDMISDPCYECIAGPSARYRRLEREAHRRGLRTIAQRIKTRTG